MKFILTVALYTRRAWCWPRAACPSPRLAPRILAIDWPSRFELPLVERRAGLVPLTFDGAAWQPYAQLAGLALPVEISTGSKKNA